MALKFIIHDGRKVDLNRQEDPNWANVAIHLEIAHQLDRQNDILERIAAVLELWSKAEEHYAKSISIR